jgi:YHS domain-containing protein
LSLAGVAVVAVAVSVLVILPGRGDTSINTDTFGVAIQGYDPVAYFTDSRVMPGKKALAYTWHEAQWYFASAAHRELFAAHPEQYTPQYGGFCANAMVVGQVSGVDPEAWRIVNGKLYLGYSKALMAQWDERPAAAVRENIQQADRQWATLHQED